MNSLSRLTGKSLDADGKTCIHWQHRHLAEPVFDPNVFDNTWLVEQQYVLSSATAGRGASLFLEINSVDLVLRHYRRGGMVRSISERHYLWLGLERTRAWREFEVLCVLEQLGLPSPKPYACQVKHRGMGYTASLITYYLAGATLAERVCAAMLSDEHWYAIGQCIAQFHQAGVDHADLNAHNILLDDQQVYLIDFDRAVIDSSPTRGRFDKNLTRLKRSLNKIGSSGPAFYNEDCWVALMKGYVQT